MQKVYKGYFVVIPDRENYLKGMKSLLSDNFKFKSFNIDKISWLN